MNRNLKGEKRDINSSIERSMKDEAVIMASPEINPNLMIIKGCRGNDLSYRGGVNTTEINFEISVEKENYEGREGSGARQKILPKASLEFDKFSNHSPEEHHQASLFSVSVVFSLRAY